MTPPGRHPSKDYLGPLGPTAKTSQRSSSIRALSADNHVRRQITAEPLVLAFSVLVEVTPNVWMLANTQIANAVLHVRLGDLRSPNPSEVCPQFRPRGDAASGIIFHSTKAIWFNVFLKVLGHFRCGRLLIIFLELEITILQAFSPM